MIKLRFKKKLNKFCLNCVWETLNLLNLLSIIKLPLPNISYVAHTIKCKWCIERRKVRS